MRYSYKVLIMSAWMVAQKVRHCLKVKEIDNDLSRI